MSQIWWARQLEVAMKETTDAFTLLAFQCIIHQQMVALVIVALVLRIFLQYVEGMSFYRKLHYSIQTSSVPHCNNSRHA